MGLMSPVVLIIREGGGDQSPSEQHAYTPLSWRIFRFRTTLAHLSRARYAKNRRSGCGIACGSDGKQRSGPQNIGAGRSLTGDCTHRQSSCSGE
jgi:hypothetical protein